MRYFALFRSLLEQELRARYLGSFSGAAWALASPLILLALYAFVFVKIFQARIPEAGAVGFIGYLAVVFWPWSAFAESLGRACSALPDNSALIGKVAIPVDLLIIVRVAGAFIVHGVGFLIVLLALKLFSVPLTLSGLPLALLWYLLLFVFALGLGLLVASVQVFVRDMAPLLAQLLTLWFFATPIIYSISLVPEAYRGLYNLNPVVHFADAFRAALIDGSVPSGMTALAMLILAGVSYLCGRWVLARCRRHFEDFL